MRGNGKKHKQVSYGQTVAFPGPKNLYALIVTLVWN